MTDDVLGAHLEQNLTLVTDDQDFSVQGVEILTANSLLTT